MSVSVNKISSSSYRTLTDLPIINSTSPIIVTSNANGSYSLSFTPQAIGIITTTNASSVATINLTSYSFSNIPAVNLTCVNSSTSTGYFAQITSVSTTSLSIVTFRTVVTSIVVGGTVNPIQLAPNTVVHISLIRI